MDAKLAVNSDTFEAKSGGQLTAIASAGGTAGSIQINATKTALMGKFYHELENATVSKAEALRRAQLAVLTSYENPYF